MSHTIKDKDKSLGYVGKRCLIRDEVQVDIKK